MTSAYFRGQYLLNHWSNSCLMTTWVHSVTGFPTSCGVVASIKLSYKYQHLFEVLTESTSQ